MNRRTTGGDTILAFDINGDPREEVRKAMAELEKADKKLKKTVPEIMRDGAATYEARQKVYGDNYKNYGKVMMGLFPNGLTIDSEEAWIHLGSIHNCVTKLGRYCADIKKGHKDSAHDLSVYAAMLEETTDE